MPEEECSDWFTVRRDGRQRKVERPGGSLERRNRRPARGNRDRGPVRRAGRGQDQGVDAARVRVRRRFVRAGAPRLRAAPAVRRRHARAPHHLGVLGREPIARRRQRLVPLESAAGQSRAPPAGGPTGRRLRLARGKSFFWRAVRAVPPCSRRTRTLRAPTGFEVFTVWPIGLIVLHLIVLGIMTCFALYPIFGRPRQPAESLDFRFRQARGSVGRVAREDGRPSLRGSAAAGVSDQRATRPGGRLAEFVPSPSPSEENMSTTPFGPAPQGSGTPDSAIEFACGNCGRLLKVPLQAAGKQARCPQCSAVQQIPAAPSGECWPRGRRRPEHHASAGRAGSAAVPADPGEPPRIGQPPVSAAPPIGSAFAVRRRGAVRRTPPCRCGSPCGKRRGSTKGPPRRRRSCSTASLRRSPRSLSARTNWCWARWWPCSPAGTC